MKVIDFSRSFLWWRVDTLKKPPQTASHQPPFTLNNARVPLDCLCRIEDKKEGGDGGFRFSLGASCKAERVGVDRDIWTEPNADFIPIMSDTQMLGVKTYQTAHMEVALYPPSRGRQPAPRLSRSTARTVSAPRAMATSTPLRSAVRCVPLPTPP